jgi:hypothetical protein
MRKKMLYALTILVGIWGMIYYPATAIIAVKPYTVHQTILAGIRALGWSPLLPFGMLIVAGVVFHLSRQMSHADKIDGCACIVWVAALLVGWATNHAAKVEYLDKQVAWSGTCNNLRYTDEPVEDPFIAGPAPLFWAKPSATCGKQRFDLYFPRNPSREDVDHAKTIFCKVSGLGTARCDSQP